MVIISAGMNMVSPGHGLNFLMICATVGISGGGWAHYVDQEKLRPYQTDIEQYQTQDEPR